MKKFILFCMVCIGLIFVGCASKEQKINQGVCNIEGADAPLWVCRSSIDRKDGIYAVGSAKKSPLGIAFQREEAMAVARDAIAREISVKVKNMFKRYLSSTGVGDAQTAERVATSVSKQVSYEVLKGSRLVNTWISPKGTMYVLVYMPKEAIGEDIKKAARTTFKNDEALWQEFKAKKAQEELDKEIEKEFFNR